MCDVCLDNGLLLWLRWPPHVITCPHHRRCHCCGHNPELQMMVRVIALLSLLVPAAPLDTVLPTANTSAPAAPAAISNNWHLTTSIFCSSPPLCNMASCVKLEPKWSWYCFMLSSSIEEFSNSFIIVLIVFTLRDIINFREIMVQ